MAESTFDLAVLYTKLTSLSIGQFKHFAKFFESDFTYSSHLAYFSYSQNRSYRSVLIVDVL